MSNEICKYEGKNVLLVESKDDCHVMLALCQKYKIAENFGINECGSKEKLLKKFEQLFNASEKPEILAVVVDAADDVISTWDSIRNIILRFPYLKNKIKNKPDNKGAIIEGITDVPSYPKIGIWIMPDNSAKGMLEDFCLKFISQDAKDFTAKCVDNAKKAEYTSYKKNHKSKAIIHTYLAWQDEPGRPLGASITSCILNSENEITSEFLKWLKALFDT